MRLDVGWLEDWLAGKNGVSIPLHTEMPEYAALDGCVMLFGEMPERTTQSAGTAANWASQTVVRPDLLPMV